MLGGINSVVSSMKNLLDKLMDHKLTFGNHFLNIIQKVYQKIHSLLRIIQKEAENYHESTFLFII